MKAIIISIIILIHIQVAAQVDSTKIQLNQVEVIKTFEANLEDAKRSKSNQCCLFRRNLIHNIATIFL
ncbi:MAG: hypothetical protein IPJ51_19980 [Saprospiraceae bacterium]|nr:hypothetical protein [Saprospiraceae bacterium]